MKERLIYICFLNLFALFLISFSTIQGDDLKTVPSGKDAANVTENVASQKEDNLAIAREKEESAKVQSSFDEVVSNENVDTFSAQQRQTFSEVTSQNSGVVTGIADATPGFVYTLVDSATAELKKADLSSASTSQDVNSSLSSNQSTDKELNNVVLKESIDVNINETNNNASNDNVTIPTEKPEEDVPSVEPKKNETETIIGTEHSEDIPSFSEWTQKQLEEAEKKKELGNESAQNQNFNLKQNSSMKVRSKNYASPDCGAKIVAANPEATNAGAVLSSSKDEYYLNVCTNRIWFIVELCEAIQAKKIDIANFELFSSSPKDFTVYVSARFPTRDWAVVGQFVAKEEKDVQSFDLHPHLFGKYIKVEVHSHYGSEHFCPISLFKVYGTSEFEVLEKEDSVHTTIEDDDDDETLDSEKGASSNNLFHSATNAVISIVKKAVEVMGNKGNTSSENDQQMEVTEKPTPLIGTCTTVRHYIQCDNCSDELFGHIYELISCKSNIMRKMLTVPFIKTTLSNTDICYIFGLAFNINYEENQTSMKESYLRTMLTTPLLGALCNTLAVLEEKLVLNSSNKYSNITNTIQFNNIEEIVQESISPHINTDIKTDDVIAEEIKSTEQLSFDNTEKLTLVPEGITEISYNTEIKPTKTLSPDDLNDTNSAHTPDTIDKSKIVQATDTYPTQPKVDADAGDKLNIEQELIDPYLTENLSEFESTTDSSEGLEENFEIISDLNNDTSSNNLNTTVNKPVNPPGPKESVFLRLSNRIKALERNMSLSSQYLEELSRRYKKQVEEMQRLLEKTLVSWSEERKQRDERTKKLEDQVELLTSMMETLMADKNNWANATYWTFIIIIIVTGLFTFCRRSSESRNYIEESVERENVKRRKSIDIVRHKAPVAKKRRPSEEALKIRGTYQDLMVDNTLSKKYKDKKRRKKKVSIARSNSMSTLTEEEPYRTSSANTSLPERFDRQESAPAHTSWDDPLRNCVEDIPFALEEPENSGLEEILPSKSDHTNKIISNMEYTNGKAHLHNINDSIITNFIRTARESRLSRSNITVQVNGHGQNNLDNGRTPSPDNSLNCGSSAPSDNVSVNSEDKTVTKKEKKGLKRFFRKVF